MTATSPLYFITVPECAKRLQDEGKNFIVLKAEKPLLPQLLSIPQGADIMATVPDCWPKAEKERFALQVNEAMSNIEISRNTFNAFGESWEANAFWNYEAAMESAGIEKIRDWFKELESMQCGKYNALIVGSGPSVKRFDDSISARSMITYAAWSAFDYKFIPTFVGHCDHREQKNGIEFAVQGSIFTPNVHPSFIKKFNPRFVYYDRGNPVSRRFSEKKGVPDHEPIVGNVVDMLTQCAIYAGHKVIKFIGVDLCCTTPEELFKYHPSTQEAIPAVNYRGEQVWTDEIFLCFQHGLEGLAARYPEIQFSNLSDKGVILEGIPFEPNA